MVTVVMMNERSGVGGDMECRRYITRCGNVQREQIDPPCPPEDRLLISWGRTRGEPALISPTLGDFQTWWRLWGEASGDFVMKYAVISSFILSWWLVERVCALVYERQKVCDSYCRDHTLMVLGHSTGGIWSLRRGVNFRSLLWGEHGACNLRR